MPSWIQGLAIEPDVMLKSKQRVLVLPQGAVAFNALLTEADQDAGARLRAPSKVERLACGCMLSTYFI